jgi:glycosyltransferase involved in cell wall biosynthesis
MAMAGVRLDVIDPAHADPEIRAIVERSLAGCGVSASVNLTSGSSPAGVHALAAGRSGIWSLFVIDGDHEAPWPESDVRACLPYAQADCAFVFHDLVSPAVAAGLRLLQEEGFNVLIYQTQQIMGFAWRGEVKPVEHLPDPDVAWQLPHHLVGLPVSGVDFGTTSHAPAAPPINTGKPADMVSKGRAQDFSRAGKPLTRPGLLPHEDDAGTSGSPTSVCIVSNEIIGPFKNGGIGTAMTGLAEHLAASGCRVTILYTGGVWAPDIKLGKWKKRYAELGIDFVALSIMEMKSLGGPVKDCGFGVAHLVYQHLAAKQFDVIHFNDCTGEGSICLLAKKLGLSFQDTLLVVALHSPSQWVLELNHTMPSSLLMSVYNYAERLSVKCADVLWSPSRYLLDWAAGRGFELPEQTFVHQYRLPSSRAGEQAEPSQAFPAARSGRTAPPREIVFFGRLEERKGLRLFCNTLHMLRQELAEQNITVTFMGKAETCGGMHSLEYITLRSRDWRFPLKTLTDLGQPEALAYLLTGGKLAVMAAPVDNSPCTVYEALACGIPFLAARTGGVPELVAEDDQEHVLFDCSTEALCSALHEALNNGGWIAAPSQSQEQIGRRWASFHAGFRRYLPRRRETDGSESRVVAIVEAQSQKELQVTLESLAAVQAVDRVIVLNRHGQGLPQTGAGVSIHDINLSVEDPDALDEELAKLTDETVLMIHSGISIRAGAFAAALSALEATDVDGLQPAAEVSGGRKRKTVLPIGGDPSFTLFEGATFTGGLLIRGAAFKRAMLGRDLAAESAFMGLADFCVTRGIEIWPYPLPVFERTENWEAGAPRAIPARVRAFDECSPTDRYYMLAAGYGASRQGAGTNQRPGIQRAVALAMIDMGLLPLVRLASRARRRIRNIQPRMPFGSPIQRLLERLLQGNR